MKLVIVGGVAGGASAAARARRLAEDAEIVLFERGPDVSFANCGLPYYLGGEIADRDKLLIVTPQRLRDPFQARRADPHRGRVHRPGEEGGPCPRPGQWTGLRRGLRQAYPGARGRAARCRTFPAPTCPASSPCGTCTTATASKQSLDRRHAAGRHPWRRLHRAGTGREPRPPRRRHHHRRDGHSQVLAPLDAEMTTPVGRAVARARRRAAPGPDRPRHRSRTVHFRREGSPEPCDCRPGGRLAAHLVVVGVGVRPENRLAVEAGLETGPGGGIRVNEQLQTSDPDIYAVGDAIEVTDFVTGQPVHVPLAGPANRQGRLAADHVFGRPVRYRGTQGTAIVRVFERTAAITGSVGEGPPPSGPGLSQGLRPPGPSRRLLSRRRGHDAEVAIRSPAGRVLVAPGRGRGGRGQAHRRAGGGHPSRHDRLRPGGDGAGLRRRNTARPRTR